MREHVFSYVFPRTKQSQQMLIPVDRGAMYMAYVFILVTSNFFMCCMWKIRSCHFESLEFGSIGLIGVPSSICS